MDFFTVPTATFRVLYVFFAIHHARRTVLHVRVTEHPTAAWIIQQLREAFPYDAVPRYLVFDNDKKYGTEVLRIIEHTGIRASRSRRTARGKMVRRNAGSRPCAAICSTT